MRTENIKSSHRKAGAMRLFQDDGLVPRDRGDGRKSRW